MNLHGLEYRVMGQVDISVLYWWIAILLLLTGACFITMLFVWQKINAIADGKCPHCGRKHDG